MNIPLALLNLLHQKVRTLVAVGGVAFAIILLFMQLGFYGSAEASATVFLENLDFDILLTSPDYLDISRPGTFPRSRVYQALAVDGVADGAPLYLNFNFWRIKASGPGKTGGKRRNIMVVGFNLADRDFIKDQVFRAAGLADLDALKVPDTVLMDTRTRSYFGPRGPGVETDLGWTRATVVGEFTIGTGFGSDGMVLTSDQTFSRLFGNLPLDRVNLGLLRLRPGARADAVAEAIRARFPDEEVRVRTRAQMEEHEKDYWLNKTSVGIIFTLGVAVALLVGTVFVYQVISSDITNRFGEFATLKAMGYPQKYLSGVVLRQAVLLAVLGYAPGLLLSLALYYWGRAEAHLLLDMTWARALSVLALAVGMCGLSGLLAIQKVKSADPADLF
jgi:putative ABC transport system permease protein